MQMSEMGNSLPHNAIKLGGDEESNFTLPSTQRCCSLATTSFIRNEHVDRVYVHGLGIAYNNHGK